MARPSLKFVCNGVDLAHPQNQMPAGYFPVLRNIRVNQAGAVSARLGLAQRNGLGDGPVHSIRRMNNHVDSTSAHFYGMGDGLFLDDTLIDKGYSGSPLSILPFRPNRSPSPLAYISDGQRQRKMDVKGSVDLVGIRPPHNAPNIYFAPHNFAVIHEFEGIFGNVLTGTASGIAAASRFDTTVVAAIYDTENFGWCMVIPADDQGFQAGAKIILQGGETTRVRDVLQPITDTQIAGILYDDPDAGTGMCSLALFDNSPNLTPNAIIRMGGGAAQEYVRVLDVVTGPDGLAAIRCKTNSTHNVGEPVTGNLSLRVYTAGLLSLGDPITSNYVSMSVALGDGALTAVNAQKLDTISPTGTGGDGMRPITPDDYIHISLMASDPASIAEIKLEIDLDDGTFTRNYLTRSILPASISGSGWNEFLFKVGDFTRIGSNPTKTLATKASARVAVTASATVEVSMAGWWLAGTYGPDVIASQAPILYAYRYRDSHTGAKSNMSPATRTGVTPQREGLVVAVEESNDPQVDSIDLMRFGGGLNQWVKVANITNTTSTITDTLSAIAVQPNEVAVFDDYQPFPISDLPRAGRCNVAGTTVQWTQGDKFNLDWVPGSLINVNGQVCSLYGSPISDTILQLAQPAGYRKDAEFSLPEPTIAAQPLPATWMYGGGQGIATYMMGVGDPYNPGFLRWCKGNDPDVASDTGNLEITSPSEPLMNGCEYDGRAFVFSTERLFAILPNFSGQGNLFAAQVALPNAGLFSRWAFCVTPYGIVWVGKDGIYIWSGGVPKNITDQSLYPLFPHAGVELGPVNGYYPPDYSQPSALRLSFASNSIYFTYLNTRGDRECLRFDFARTGWFPESYTPEPVVFYQEEAEDNAVLMAAANGTIHTVSAPGKDNATDVACEIQTPYTDLGDSRILKYFPDVMVDHAGAEFSLSFLFDNGKQVVDGGKVSSVNRLQNVIGLAVRDGEQLSLYQNIALSAKWNGDGALYEFQPNAIAQPLLVPGLVTPHTDNGIPGFSHVKDAWVALISTAEVVLDIWVDGVKRSYSLPSTGGRFRKVKLALGPMKGETWMYRLSSTQLFIPFTDDTLIQVKAWGSVAPFTPIYPFKGLAA